MHKLIIKISDNSIDQVLAIFKDLPKADIEIIEDRVIEKGSDDFINRFVAAPVRLPQSDFLSRDEANAR